MDSRAAAADGSGGSDASLYASPLAGVRPSDSPVARKLRRQAESESESESSGGGSDNNRSARRLRSPRPPLAKRGGGGRDADRRALKKAVEKKFRLRYDALQQAYEQRLRALAALVDGAVGQIQQDAAMQCLQESPLTLEFASARLGEIIQESFFGEREKYVKAMSDQIAWQASDLRELQQKLRIAQRREGEAQQQWKLAQRDLGVVHRQLELRVQELQDQKKNAESQEQKLADALVARDALRLDVEKLKHAVEALSGVQNAYTEFKTRVQSDREKSAAARDTLMKTVKELEEARNKLELERQASEQEAAHLRQMLHAADAKTQELSESLHDLQHQAYPAKLARADVELEHLKQLVGSLEKENESLRQRYEEFGAQVDQYMQEQAQEKATVVAKSDEQLKRLEAQMDDVRRQAQEALRAKQQEILRTTDQLKVRHEALGRLEQKNSVQQERISALEAQLAEEKVRTTQHAGKLEKEITQGRLALEREQEKIQGAKKALTDMKEKYEGKIKSLQEALALQNQQTVKEKELEARTRWQNEFVSKQEARVEALKAKYDAALENQQNELLRARQAAVTSATTAATKIESARTSLKQEEDQERLRRAEALAREQKRKEDEEADRARLAAHKKAERELDDREKRLLERERAMLEREAVAERRKQALDTQQKQVKEAAAAAAARAAAAAQSSAAPNVVVMNANTGDDDRDSSVGTNTASHQSSGKTVKVINKVPGGGGSHRAVGSDSSFVPRGQHEAELAAREAQTMLRAEERVKTLMREFEERKENEFRAAMVNVRKGIHKLEAALEEAKAQNKSLEEQLLNERQAFVILKQENEELRESRGPIVQRLEEANENIGRLRAVVKESREKYVQLEEQLKNMHRSNEQTAQTVKESQRSMTELQERSKELEQAKASIEASLQASESGRKELQDHVLSLENKLRKEREHFDVERIALGERSTKELQSTSVQYDSALQHLQEQVQRFEADNRENHERSMALELELRKLREENEQQKAAMDRGKADLGQQRKEFADLARMHKNLKDSMHSAVEDERSRRIAAETQSLELVKEVARVRSRKETDLRTCHEQLQQVVRDWADMKRSVRSDLQLAWSQMSQDVSATGLTWQKRVDILMADRDSKWRQRIKQDKHEWKRLLAQKDSEMDAMLSSRRVTDQSKYDQLAHRLEQKAEEVNDSEARLGVQVDLNTSLQQTIEKMERDAEYRQQELSTLQQAVLTAQEKTTQHQQAKDAAVVALEKWKRIADKLRAFVVSIGQDKQACGSDFTALTAVEPSPAHPLDDPDWSENFDLRELSRQLGRIGALVRENGEKIAATVKQESSQPLASELESAKRCLEQYWRPALLGDTDALDSDTSMASEDALFYYQHLPWFVAVDRAIVRMKKTHEDQLASLRSDVARISAERQSALDSGVQLQNSINVLRFEKETLLQEMETLSKTMLKQKNQELLDQRADFERRIDQLKLHAERDHMKTEQDLESQVEQLRALLDTERRASSNAKNDAINYKMEFERVQEEFRDTQQRLEKQLDELRDTCNRWRRKAKIAMKATGSGTVPAAAANLLLSSASFSTEEDSDASYRTLLLTPRRRRPSSAMADLSSLMEQSLSTIRQEAVAATPPRLPTASSRQ